MSVSDYIVLGAGMVGVATALALQEVGHHVVVMDRGKPGREASYGNAGLIQTEAVEPYAMPRALSEIIAIAFKRANSVNYQLSALPSEARNLLLYYQNSKTKKHHYATQIHSQLVRRSAQDHNDLIQAAHAEHLVRKLGYFQAHRNLKKLGQDIKAAEFFANEFGVASAVLSGSDLMHAEPALNSSYVGAIHWQDAWSCSDPGELVRLYASLFQKRGGDIIESNIINVEETRRGWQVNAACGKTFITANIVVALGASSSDFLKGLGIQIPMVRKRGYHRHYAMKKPLNRPLFDADASSVFCPMDKGLRVTTGAEIAHYPNGKISYRQLNYAEAMARSVMQIEEPVEAEPWSGWRPCMPDMLPVVGALSKHKGLWCNFGHGHQGFTLGPTTANILARQTSAQVDDQLFSSLSPNRFC